MPTNFEKLIQYFKDKYYDEKELITNELEFKELFLSKINSERQNYSHVYRLFAYHGFLVPHSKDKFVLHLDKIRNYSGGL